MKRSTTTKTLWTRLAPLVSRSDQISARIMQLIADGDVAGAELLELETERGQIDVQLGQILGDEGTDRSPRTSIWRARAVLAEDRAEAS